MKKDSDPEARTIVPPVVLFLDDGVNVFVSVTEAERSLELWMLRENPDWQGFDSQHAGVRPELFCFERRGWFFEIKDEGVRLRIDPSLSLDSTSEKILEQMRERLFGIQAEWSEEGFIRPTGKDMFDLILTKAAGERWNR